MVGHKEIKTENRLVALNNLTIAKRLSCEVSPRALAKAALFGWRGIGAVRRFNRRLKEGRQFPAFMMISVTNRCNLSCQGCWVTPTPPVDMDPALLERTIRNCLSQGCNFFGILGGEPLLHEGLLEVLAKFPQAYFQLFTNGHRLDDRCARSLRQLGNVTPLISIEGLERVADERRGGQDVAALSLAAIRTCRQEKLLTGVATSVCQSNFDQVVQEAFVKDMASRGVHYVWYYIYRPVGPQPTPELCLADEQIQALRRFLVDARTWAPVIVVDTYWDAEGRALCPAAMGISYHITPTGYIEPCPIVQCSYDRIDTGVSIVDAVEQSDFLRRFREFSTQRTRACILMKDPHAYGDFAQDEGATDSSGRETFYEELKQMQTCPTHDMGQNAIPERSLLYRFAKKNWFFGFGAYG